jgi:hypothetical protein
MTIATEPPGNTAFNYGQLNNFHVTVVEYPVPPEVLYLDVSINGGEWALAQASGQEYGAGSKIYLLSYMSWPTDGDVLTFRAADPSGTFFSNELALTYTAAAGDEARANPRSDWTVPQLDAWAAEHGDTAPDYPADANKPEKLAYIKSVIGDD